MVFVQKQDATGTIYDLRCFQVPGTRYNMNTIFVVAVDLT